MEAVPLSQKHFQPTGHMLPKGEATICGHMTPYGQFRGSRAEVS